MMTKECYILRNVETRAYFNKALLRNHNCEFNTCLMFLDQKKKKKTQACGLMNPDVWHGSVCVTEAKLFVSFKVIVIQRQCCC